MSQEPLGEVESFAWVKSSYSGGSGGNCVEVATTWTKSTHSGPSGGDCLEVAVPSRACVHVRDSKQPALATLTFAPAHWASLTTPLRRNA